MKELYSDLNIRFSVDGTVFSAQNIAKEQMTLPIPNHRHGSGSYEIHYIHSGRGAVRIGSELLPLSPRTLYVTGPFVAHEQIPRQDDPMVEYSVYLRMERMVSPPDSVAARFAARHYWFGTDTEELDLTLQQLFLELEQRAAGYTNMVESLLQQCVVKLLRNYETGGAAKRQFSAARRLDSRVFFVEKTLLYDGESVTLGALSEALGLSPRQTERFLVEAYGMTFRQKKLEAKMAKAVSLLEDPALPISEIAERLDYASIQHFSAAFRKYFGVPPTKYRAAANRRGE